MVVHACNLSHSGCRGRVAVVQGRPRKKHESLSEKNKPKKQRTVSVAHMVERLLSKCTALTSISSKLAPPLPKKLKID
jgi:hypothetical protein